MFFRYNFPGVIWSLFILVLISLPQNDFPDASFLHIPNLDKIVHFLLFLFLAILVARGFALQSSSVTLKKYFSWLSVFIGITYGAMTEILQATVFTWRSCSLFDFIADVIGCLAGIGFYLLILKKIIPLPFRIKKLITGNQ